MGRCRVVLSMPDGTRVWLNLYYAVKMLKTPDNRYFLYMQNGECYEISHSQASEVEDYFR